MKIITLFVIVQFILFTNLNAQEWQDLNMPNDTTIFHKMCQVDNNFWAVDYGNGLVFYSDDHGQNWNLQKETEGEFLEAIQFLNKDVGFLCGDYGIIMKTTNGGKTWREIGPPIAARVTKEDTKKDNPVAIKRYYYQMHFKNENHGLLWGFDKNPLKGWRSMRRFYFETLDSGKSWTRIDYKRGENDSIVNAYLEEVTFKDEVAMNIYHRDRTFYSLGNSNIEISKDERENWINYPLPEYEERCMFRTVNFINDHQGYIFGGNFEEPSQGYILETLDGGKSWRRSNIDLPHIHWTMQKSKEIWLSGKEGLLKKWNPIEKQDSSFIHTGNTSKILIDGKISKDEWSGANRTIVKEGIDLYTLQDDYFVYLSIQFDTTKFLNYYCDLFFEVGQDSLLNIHSSSQKGERLLRGMDWTDNEPPFNWGNINDWNANQIIFNRSTRSYIPYTALEFQISKKKLPKKSLKLAFQARDLNWEKEIVNWPKNNDFKTLVNWNEFYIK